MDEIRHEPGPRPDLTTTFRNDGLPPCGPTHFGRYEVLELLGEGGYGVVYKAHDPQLRRLVAIKVPRPERIESPADAEAYLNEARVLAGLNHAGIVRVLDVGRTDDGACYVVSEFMPKGDLAHLIAQRRPSHDEAAELAARVADALDHAHRCGLVHRDIKPGNILLDAAGQPLVADFGLALADESFGKGASYCGTPAYMSPEQARGEGHRVDARSDIYSLGVVFYELLTGRRPYRSKELSELLDEISSGEVRPPRQLDSTIPNELERICLKTLAKRAADRYTTVLDLADDLRHWKRRASDAVAELARVRGADGAKNVGILANSATPPTPSSQPPKVVPKGLRSFDANDADFFLQLLPGPTDRDGLPESLRFWKTRIDETDADQTFAVGLMYGPSGCGKTSLVKAGQLPRLAPHVLTVYLEATPDDTEARLLKALRKVCGAGVPPADAPAGGTPAPQAPQVNLIETLAALRRGQWLAPGQKLLIVLDQFEQWLHSHRDPHGTELVRALRHCDGGHVQCVVMVRDDFWMAASQFLRELEIPLVEGENSAAVYLFDARHARRVLTLFGRAFGCLGRGAGIQPDGAGGRADALGQFSQAGKPNLLGELTPEQEQFLDQAVAGLAEDGKVVSVRLALFAEMVKGKPWTPATLKEIGGIAGVGVTFLEETFSASTAPPRHRLHQQAARAVLKALLPEAGADIKGHRRGAGELLAASGYERRPDDFKELVGILDAELRLITPADESAELRAQKAEQGNDTEDSSAPRSAPGHPRSGSVPRSYQLTHDYLVPSLRGWLTRKQRETRRGRAELRLAERSAGYAAKPDARFLPSWWEWPNILTYTKRKTWTLAERRVMRAAGRRRLAEAAGAVLLLAVLGFSAFEVRRRVELGRRRIEAAALVKRLLDAPLDSARRIAAELEPYRALTDGALADVLSPANAEAGERQRLRAAIGLLSVDPAHAERIYRALLVSDPGDARALIDVLAPRQADYTSRLWREATDEQAPAAGRLPAAAALASYEPTSARWAGAAAEVARRLVSVNPADLGGWRDALSGVAPALVPALSDIFADPAEKEVPRSLATAVLADYVKDDPQTLVGLLTRGDAAAFGTFFPVLQGHAAGAVAKLQAALDTKLEPDWRDAPLEPAWGQPPVEAVEAIERAHGLIAERFVFGADLPWEEFAKVAEQLSASGYRPTRVRPYRLTPASTTPRRRADNGQGTPRVVPSAAVAGLARVRELHNASQAGILANPATGVAGLARVRENGVAGLARVRALDNASQAGILANPATATP